MQKLPVFKTDRLAKYTYLAVLVIWFGYLITNFITPVDESTNRLGVSAGELFLIRLTIALPYLLIWLAAAYAFIQAYQYALTLGKGREARALYYIGAGIGALLLSLMLSAIFSSLDNLAGDQSSFHKMMTILTNYARIFPFLIAFDFFWRGGQLLANRVQAKISVTQIFAYGLVLALFCYLWLELIFTNESRTLPVPPDTTATYYLKDSLIVLTIVIPSIVTWSMGLAAIFNLNRYANRVKGIIYRQALSALVWGIWGVIIFSIALQALLSLGTERLLDLGLAKILGIVYLFLILMIASFVYIALGAKRLTKIEEVSLK